VRPVQPPADLSPTAEPAGPLEPAPLAVPRWYGAGLWAVTVGLLAVACLIALLVGVYIYHDQPALGAILAVAVFALASWRNGRVLLRPSPAAFVVGVVALAVALRYLAVLLVPYFPSKDFLCYHDTGRHLAETGVFCPGGYRCFWPPLQVGTIGGLYRALGTNFRWVQFANVLYGGLTVGGVWLLARRVFSERVARTAALLAALTPSMVFACVLLGAEVPETFWFVAALVAFVTVDRRRRLGWAEPILCGILLGVASLIRPTFVLLPFALGLHMLLSWRRRRGAALATAVGILLGTALTVAPWTARNYRVTGGFVLVSSTGGINLYSGNNDDAKGDYTRSASQHCYDISRDDLELQANGTRLALEWIRTHPGRFAQLAGAKFLRFWSNDIEIAWWALHDPSDVHEFLDVHWRIHYAAEGGSTGFYIACLAAAVVGLWLRRRQLVANRAWMFMTVLCLYFTCIHMVFESQAKYRFMLTPLLCIYAALPPISPRRRLGKNTGTVTCFRYRKILQNKELRQKE
jgi:4-amino-4-deoxy-L-arabinose transferase-like glycosyltransferase